MPIGADSIRPVFPPAQRTVRPLVETYPDGIALDPLTRNTRGLRGFATPAFDGSADATLVQVSPGQRLRIKRLVLFISANAATGVSNGSEITIQLIEHGQATGIEWYTFVTQNTVVGANGGQMLALDLGDGWVSGQSSFIQVHSNVTLTNGHFLVTALGQQEQAS